jgi:T5SS/PEP-CTERM-associated repeat protein
LTSSSSIYIGGDGGGALLIEAGGQVSNTSGYVGNNSGSTGTVTVIGTNSNWTNSSTLYVGSAGSGTLTIETGGQVAAKRVTINNKSVVGLHVSGNNMLLLGSTTEAGVVTNSGKTNLYADVFLPAAGYTPISDLQRRSMTWSGTGTYNAFGGTWDSVSKTFVVPAATGVGAGNTATLATGTRTIFTDAAGHRAGVSTGVVTGTPTMVANSMTGGQLDGIGLLPGEAVVAAWDFNTTLTGETLLSFDVGQGLSDLRAWRYSSGAWAPFDTHVVYREGIASFSVTGFSGYAVSAVPEPATWTMLLAAAAALGLYRWRKRRA